MRALQLASLAGLAVLVLDLAFGIAGRDEALDTSLYVGVMLAAAALCLSRAVTERSERAAWGLLGAALVLSALGEIWFFAFLADHEVTPIPSVSDAFILAFYPASYAGLVLLVRGRVHRFETSLWLDGAIGALAVGSLAVALLLSPVLGSTGRGVAEVATSLAYPVGDLLLLALVIGVFALTGWRPGAVWGLLGAGLAGLALADILFLWLDTRNTYVEGSLLDALWPASALAMGYAAWRPPARQTTIRLEGRRVHVAPAAFALIALGVLALGQFNPIHTLAVALALAAIMAVVARMSLAFSQNLGLLDAANVQAHTDALTGLANRRALMTDLQEEVDHGEGRAVVLLFDLNGFKSYNDAFGHPAGDALLARLAGRLRNAVGESGGTYRLGGDEFCAFVRHSAADPRRVAASAIAALAERGEAFDVSTSCGQVTIPDEAGDVTGILGLADRRLYDDKDSSRKRPDMRGSRDVLLKVLDEREPELRGHLLGVAQLARAVGERLGVTGSAMDELVRSAELHDVGKLALPDSVLEAPRALDELERQLINQHTIIGERILAAASALVPVAKTVRSTHERWDGGATPTAWSAPASRWPRGSSSYATPTTP